MMVSRRSQPDSQADESGGSAKERKTVMVMDLRMVEAIREQRYSTKSHGERRNPVHKH
jgi:hypothetical protein